MVLELLYKYSIQGRVTGFSDLPWFEKVLVALADPRYHVSMYSCLTYSFSMYTEYSVCCLQINRLHSVHISKEHILEL